MSLRQYLTSKVFFAQVLAAMAIFAVIAFLFFHWITYTTNHGQEITVPDLSKLSAEQAEEKLDALDLDYIILDTVDFRPEFPKLTIVEQEPKAGAKVKEGRKISVSRVFCILITLLACFRVLYFSPVRQIIKDSGVVWWFFV